MNRILIALAFLVSSPAIVFSQIPDVYIGFGQGANVSSFSTADVSDGTGSAFVYVRNGFDVGNFDLDFGNSDTSVIRFTNAQLFNQDFGNGFPILGRRFNIQNDPADPASFGEVTLDIDTDGDGVDDDTTGASGRFFGVSGFAEPDSASTPGIASNLSAFDLDFDSVANAFLLGQIDFDIVGQGTVDLTLALGELGFVRSNMDQFPVLGDGTLVVASAIPEPGSATLLALGIVGWVARRRRRA